MVEDEVMQHLRTLTDCGALPAIGSCRVSMRIEPPWGKPYRVVEWTTEHDADACRQAVPADSTALEIAQTVAQHVPGRRITPNGEPLEAPRAWSRRRTARAA